VCDPRTSNRRDLTRLLQIADVEDADAAEPLGAHFFRHALRPAIDAADVCSTDMNSR